MEIRRNVFRFQTIFPLFIIVFLLFTSYSISAYDDCPYGIENDPYPGICSRYIDQNKDGICDHSQSEQIVESDISIQAPSESSVGVGGVPLQENENLIKLVVSFVLILIVYLVLRFCTRSKILSKAKERLVWNILLLIFFIPSALTGIFLILVVSFPFLRDFGILFLDFHNVTSYFFMWISAYHIIVHIRYYVKGIKGSIMGKK
jgi:hypothetical protein